MRRDEAVKGPAAEFHLANPSHLSPKLRQDGIVRSNLLNSDLAGFDLDQQRCHASGARWRCLCVHEFVDRWREPILLRAVCKRGDLSCARLEIFATKPERDRAAGHKGKAGLAVKPFNAEARDPICASAIDVRFEAVEPQTERTGEVLAFAPSALFAQASPVRQSEIGQSHGTFSRRLS